MRLGGENFAESKKSDCHKTIKPTHSIYKCPNFLFKKYIKMKYNQFRVIRDGLASINPKRKKKKEK